MSFGLPGGFEGLRDLLTAKELLSKAELAAKAFVEAARVIVFVDNLAILHAARTRTCTYISVRRCPESAGGQVER